MNIAEFTQNEEIIQKAKTLIFTEEKKIEDKLNYYKKRLSGKRVAIYVGGAFKAISLIKQFRDLGMETVMVGTQTGKEENYDIIKELTLEGTVILDDTNPSELEKFILEKKADILAGGVKERPLAYKLGIPFVIIIMKENMPYAAMKELLTLHVLSIIRHCFPLIVTDINSSPT